MRTSAPAPWAWCTGPTTRVWIAPSRSSSWYNVPPEVSKARLLAEARAAAKLNHPNICTIHEVGEVDGHAFIVMEYIDGQPLSAADPAQGLALETVLEYGIQIADAVAYAHAAGIVHRDLKSSNIVHHPEGRPKVLDFGLALRMPIRVERRAASDRRPSTYRARAWLARRSTCRPNRCVATARIHAVTSGRSASCCMRWPPGRRPYDKRQSLRAGGRRPFGCAGGGATNRRAATGGRHQAMSGQTGGAAISGRPARSEPRSRRWYRPASTMSAAPRARQRSDRCADRKPRRGGARRRWCRCWWLGIAPLRNAIGGLVSEPAIAFAERDWLLVSDFRQSGRRSGIRSVAQHRAVGGVDAVAIRQHRAAITHSRGSAPDGEGRA